MCFKSAENQLYFVLLHQILFIYIYILYRVTLNRHYHLRPSSSPLVLSCKYPGIQIANRNISSTATLDHVSQHCINIVFINHNTLITDTI